MANDKIKQRPKVGMSQRAIPIFINVLFYFKLEK